MANVIVYSTLTCRYCVDAKEFLDSKGIEFKVIYVDQDPQQEKEMQAKTGKNSVPQILINGKHIGGFTDLKNLDATGKLDALLNEGRSNSWFSFRP
jgi:glutaredoxin 3